MEKHKSVLLDEAINYLNIKSDGVYVDATLGFAGHSSEILKRVSKGYLYAFDKDVSAISYSKEKLSKIGDNFKIFNTGFMNMKLYLEEEVSSVDGVLFDIGVSSAEIDDGSRGFSYMHDGPLDMRMNRDSSLSAYDVVNNYSFEDLVRIFREYGEEKHAYKIAKCIDEARSVRNIETTFELVDIIDKCYPYKEKRNGHPAKKVFQAIRIEVNNELEELVVGLKSSLDLLNVGGRVVVITFHSLEDRIVKNLFKEMSDISPVVKGMPNVPLEMLPDFKLVTNKPIIPSDYEMNSNPRSKSAKLRVIERVK